MFFFCTLRVLEICTYVRDFGASNQKLPPVRVSVGVMSADALTLRVERTGSDTLISVEIHTHLLMKHVLRHILTRCKSNATGRRATIGHWPLLFSAKLPMLCWLAAAIARSNGYGKTNVNITTIIKITDKTFVRPLKSIRVRISFKRATADRCAQLDFGFRRLRSSNSEKHLFGIRHSWRSLLAASRKSAEVICPTAVLATDAWRSHISDGIS